MHGRHLGNLTVYTQTSNDENSRIMYDDYAISGEHGTQWLQFRKTIPMYGGRKRVRWNNLIKLSFTYGYIVHIVIRHW